MASTRPAAASKRIPGTMTFNLRRNETQASRPVVRRPVTACESCRGAKVKCSGQQPCGRCKSRSFKCVHQPQRLKSDATQAASASQTTQTSPATSTLTGQMIEPLSGVVPLQLNGDTDSSMGGGNIDWMDEDLDWSFPEAQPILGPGYGDLGNPSLFDSLPDISPLPVQEDGRLLTTSPNSNLQILPLGDQFSIDNCQCRAGLVSYVPQLETVTREHPTPQLDKMLKTMEDVIQKCQATLHCQSCEMRPADLVCIVAIFQQTAACFDYISKSGLGGTMEIGIGGYKMSTVCDLTFKRTLVLNLVKQAETLLDSLSELGQSLYMAQPSAQRHSLGRSPPCLNQVNLGYVREVVLSFKKFFRLITDVIDEKGTRP